jgi:GNAT superfamily N-acetyltransferase
MLALMLDTDRLDREVLVAVAEEKIVGHAIYVRLGNDAEADMAITVEDDWRSMGVGKSLLSELAQRARVRGIESEYRSFPPQLMSGKEMDRSWRSRAGFRLIISIVWARSRTGTGRSIGRRLVTVGV